MKMFMYSLEGDVDEWYWSLSPSSISSLKVFHTTFNEYGKQYILAEFLFENCCEEFEEHIQHVVGFYSICKDEETFMLNK